MKLIDSLGLVDYKDSDSNKYNQNKNKAVAIAKYFLKQTNQNKFEKISRDLADALLHAVYFIQHVEGFKLQYTT